MVNLQKNLKPLSDKKVIDYTATLWKYKPLPDNEPENAPEYIHDDKKFQFGEIISARVRGKKHKHNGTNCDDWYESDSLENIVFAAVSDGAGSKKFSRIGAKSSCLAAVGYMRKSFTKFFADNPAKLKALNEFKPEDKNFIVQEYGEIIKIVKDSVIEAQKAVISAYESRKYDPEYTNLVEHELNVKDFSATLLVAAVVSLCENQRLIITCQIGDGVMALLNSKAEFTNSVKLMGDPDSGEFSGETDFITSLTPETLDRKTKIAFSDSDLFFMMTDGVSDDYFPASTEIQRLYLDLVLNGILDGVPAKIEPLNDNELYLARKLLYDEKLNDNEKQQLELIREDYRKKHLPEIMLKSLALSYPSITKDNQDMKIKIPVQYTQRLCEEGFRSIYKREYRINDLWENREILTAIKNIIDDSVTDKSKILELWLDNYTVRGSHDDRTLVIMKFENE